MWNHTLLIEGDIAMAEERRTLLSVGAFFLILVVGIVLYLANIITWPLILPVFLMLFGVWTLALAAMRGANPEKHARTAFGTMGLGVCIVAVGGAWSLIVLGYNWLYALVVILFVFGALAIAAALKRK
jgi:hypothetical protein